MVDRILDFIGQKISGLHEAAYLLAFFALLSQILALVRDRLLAHFFGAGQVLDIYYASFRIPDFIFASVASLVSISVLIPFLSSRLEEDVKDVRSFLNHVFTSFFFFISFVSLVVFIFTPYLVQVIYPGFTDADASQIILLTRILLLSPILLGVSNLLASVTQTLRQFFVYALSPLLYNVGIIFGILFLYPLLGIRGLGYGVIAGAILHLAIQVPVVRASGFMPRISFKLKWEEIKSVVFTSLPRTFALSTNQLALLFLVSLASLMASGSIAIFNLSFNLQSVPLSIIGVSYSLAAFPTLSRLYSSGQTLEFFNTVVAATRYIIFWTLPAIVLFIVLRAQIVRTLFGSGQFDWDDTRLTAAALALFVFSLIGQSLNQLFVRGYYAAGNTKKPLIVNLISSAFIIISGFFLVSFYEASDIFRYFIEALLRVEGIADTSILMLPLAYSAGLLLNGALFWIFFQRDFHSFSFALYRTFAHSLSAAVLAGTASYLSLLYLGSVLDLSTLYGIFLQGFVAGVIGICVAILTLILLKNKEVKEVGKSLFLRWGGGEALESIEEVR
jgi:putative peptidoglycan lipid II flippase